MWGMLAIYYLHGLKTEINCNVELTVIDSLDESDCMTLTTAIPREQLLKEQTAGFFDGYQYLADNPYSGKYKMAEEYYGNRPYYYKHIPKKNNRNLLQDATATAEPEATETVYYIWYDETWRYWVFHPVLGTREYAEWHMFCLDWMSYEPWNCNEWHIPGSIDVILMTTNPLEYSIDPTISPTLEPTTPTTEPTNKPTYKVTIADNTNKGNAANTSGVGNDSWISWLIGGLIGALCCCLICILFFVFKRKNKRGYDFDHRGSHSAVHLGTPPEDKIDISMVQMYGNSADATPSNNNSTPGYATGESATPHHASHESGSSNNKDSSNDGFNGIDGLDGDVTGRMSRNSKSGSGAGSGSGSGSGSSTDNSEAPLNNKEKQQYVARRSTTGTMMNDGVDIDLHESDNDVMYDYQGVNPFEDDVDEVQGMLNVDDEDNDKQKNWVKFDE